MHQSQPLHKQNVEPKIIVVGFKVEVVNNVTYSRGFHTDDEIHRLSFPDWKRKRNQPENKI